MSFVQKNIAVIMTTINNHKMLSKTLPSYGAQLEEVNGVLVIYDCSTGEHRAKVLEEVERVRKDREILLIQSDNVSASVARNLAFELCRQNFNPEIVGFVEDDHVAHGGFLTGISQSINALYGSETPSGLRAGLFSGCSSCNGGDRTYLNENKDFVRDSDSAPSLLGGVNACCRFAPTSHWQNVIGPWDVDEYLISEFQTQGVGIRNYNRGYCSVIVANGKLMSELYQAGRGTSDSSELRLWDSSYTASDYRSEYKGKTPSQKVTDRKLNVRGRVKHFAKKLIR